MMEGRKRKKSPHHTACWECHRLHRSCDGDRPCQRCRVTGKGSSCQSLAKTPYTRKRKPSPEQWMNEQTLSLSIFHQSTNISTAIPPVPILPAPTTTITFETKTSNRNEEAKDVLLTELLHRVQQVQELTQSLQIQQELLSEQLLSLQSAQQTSPPNETDRSIASSASSLETNSSFPNALSEFDVGQITLAPALPLSTSTQQEFLDLLDILHTPKQNLAFGVANDAERFKESLFLPFAIKDASRVTTSVPPKVLFANLLAAILCIQAYHLQLGQIH